MARPEFTVKHFVACLEARVIPPAGVYNQYILSGVGPVYRLPAPPAASIPRVELYTRFYVTGPGSIDFELGASVRTPRGWRAVNTYGPYTVFFRPGEPVRDYVFRTLHVPIRGPGLYRFLLIPVGGRVIAAEYLEVE